MACGCARLRARATDVLGETIPSVPPREFLYVAATNVVYFALAYYMLKHNNVDGWPVLLIGVVSSVYHSFPTAAALYVDTVVSSLFILYFVTKYGPRVKNRRYFALSIVLFSIGVGLLFLNGFQPVDQKGRLESWYVYGHGAWHALSAAATLLFLWSTKP